MHAWRMCESVVLPTDLETVAAAIIEMRGKLTQQVLGLPAIKARPADLAFFEMKLSESEALSIFCVLISQLLRNSSLHPLKNCFPATKRFFPLRAIM